jgi:excisionase family DNA binding protein
MGEAFLKKRLFSLSEAAQYLGRSTWSVRRLIWNGELPQVRAGGRVHVDVRDLDDFIEKHKVREEATLPYQRRLDNRKANALPDAIT